MTLSSRHMLRASRLALPGSGRRWPAFPMPRWSCPVRRLDMREREELLRISRDVEGFMAGFDDAMSAYGCSVCGELFRRVDE